MCHAGGVYYLGRKSARFNGPTSQIGLVDRSVETNQTSILIIQIAEHRLAQGSQSATEIITRWDLLVNSGTIRFRRHQIRKEDLFPSHNARDPRCVCSSVSRRRLSIREALTLPVHQSISNLDAPELLQMQLGELISPALKKSGTLLTRCPQRNLRGPN
ncbi:hypothetical protein K0M31_009655, partial [Melipona bicolor]